MKIQIFNIVTILFISFIAFTSCVSEEICSGSKIISDNDTIKFNFQIETPSRNKVEKDISMDNKNEIYKCKWNIGDEIGVFAIDENIEGKPIVINNLKFQYTEGGNWIADNNENYWTKRKLSFYAYYPYNTNFTNPKSGYTFQVKTDQRESIATVNGDSINETVTTNFCNSDLLVASSLNKEQSNGNVSLVFSHMLSMVQITVPWAGDDWLFDPRMTIKIPGIKTNVTLNLIGETGITVTTQDTDVKEITMNRVEKVEDENYWGRYTYRAIIPSQSIQSSNNYIITNGERTFISKGPEINASTDNNQCTKFIIYPPNFDTFWSYFESGDFIMGSESNELTTYYEKGYRPENQSEHYVKLTKGFYISRYEITNEQFSKYYNRIRRYYSKSSNGTNRFLYTPNDDNLRIEDKSYSDINNITHYYSINKSWNNTTIFFMKSIANNNSYTYSNSNWSYDDKYGKFPINSISWYTAKDYAEWLGFSLPTEAQWEYACRGGSGIEKVPFCSPIDITLNDNYSIKQSNINDYANISASVNSDNTTIKVGSKSYTSRNLYDMYGNVAEFCLDEYKKDAQGKPENYPESTKESPAIDPISPNPGELRICRGGYCTNIYRMCRSGHRDWLANSSCVRTCGIRLVFIP